MARPKRTLLLITLGSIFLGSQVAMAAPITFTFTGTVLGTPGGIWWGQGTEVTGFYTYDTLLLDQQIGDGDSDLFRSETPGNESFLWEISVTVGTVTRTTASNLNAAGTPQHRLEVFDRAGEDRFRLDANRRITSDDIARIMVRDFSPAPPDGIAVGTGNLTDTAPTTALNVALFDTVVGLSYYGSYDAAGAHEGSLAFTLTSVVPEPSTALLLAIGLFGLGVRKRKRAA